MKTIDLSKYIPRDDNWDSDYQYVEDNYGLCVEILDRMQEVLYLIEKGGGTYGDITIRFKSN